MTNETLKQQVKLSGKTLTEVALALGVNKATVSRWCNRRVPAERAHKFSEVTGLPVHQIRPDLFPGPVQ